jgi:hypothetical protein
LISRDVAETFRRVGRTSLILREADEPVKSHPQSTRRKSANRVIGESGPRKWPTFAFFWRT